jgi:hypothetical protein
MKKLIIFSLSLAYCIYLSSILVADLYSQKKIDLALKLNPLNSEYYYQKYTQLKTPPNYIQSAIELEPTKASYHMFYALALLKQKGAVPDSVIKHELETAVKLKPFSKLYQKTLNDYLPSLKP